MSGREHSISIKLMADGTAFAAGIDGAVVKLTKLGDTAEGVDQKIGHVGQEMSAKNKLEHLFKATRTEAENLNRTLQELEDLRPYATTAREVEALERATLATKTALAAQSAETRQAGDMQERLSRIYRNTRTELELLEQELRDIEETRPFAKTPEQLAAVERASTAVRGQIAEIAAANDNAAGKTKLTTQQLQTLQYTASDVAASLASGASPFMILMQQGGQVLQVFPKIAGPVLAIAAAVAAVVAPLAIVGSRIASTAEETRTLSTVLQAMRKEAGLTGQELRNMAVASTKIGGSRDDAFQAALVLARTSAIQTKELLRDILNIGPDVAAVMGAAIPDAAKRLADGFGKGAEGVMELDRELNFLTAAQVQLIRQMEAQGDKAGALGTAMRALQQRFSGSAVAMRSDWGNALHDMGMAWDAYVDRIASSPVAQYVAQKFSEAGKAVRESLEREAGTTRASQLSSEIARIDREYARLPEKTSGVQATHEALIRRRIELQRELNTLTAQDNAPPSNGAGGTDATTGGMTDRKIKEMSASFDDAAAACEFPDGIALPPGIVSIFEEKMK